MKLFSRILISFIALSLVSLLVGCSTYIHSRQGETTTIILTRHGDRDNLANSLNDKGRERAEALVMAVGNMNVTAIYCPDMKRNLDTARPLAEHLGIEISVLDMKPDKIAKTMLTRHSGETVVWVGNTGNLPGIYSHLGGDGAAPTSYGDLFIMEVKDSGDPVVTKIRYGPL
jgi:hypothetical protein